MQHEDPPSTPLIRVIETPSLGNRSYVIAQGVEAIVIDPPRDIDRVQTVLDDVGAVPVLVLETHRHADYLTGGLVLARIAGARYAAPADPLLTFEYEALTDGTSLQVAGLDISAVHTPGHTPHHLSYVLSQNGIDIAAFTGGSMLYGAVGRTDLVDPALTERLSREQYHSIHRLANELPGPTAVYPTHGFGSFCSATPTTDTDSSTIDSERDHNPALTAEDIEQFVADLLAGYDAYPAYYAHMPLINAAGPGPIDLSPPTALDAESLADAVADGTWVVDLRSRSAYADGHRVGTLSFGTDGNMAVYLAWLIPWGSPVVLLGETAEQVSEAQRELARVGIDRPMGASAGAVEQWTDSAEQIASFRRVDFADLAEEAKSGRDIAVLDVRRNLEWSDSHLVGAIHIPLHDLQSRLDDVPDAEELWVHCGTGYRAAAAASILERADRSVVLVDDDFEAAEDKGNELVRPGQAGSR